MSVTLVYPTAGRGAWPDSGTGGTLNNDGTAAGPFYRAPAVGVVMPGLVAARAVKAGQSVDVNNFAVYAAIQFIQSATGSVIDGIFGTDTGKHLATWQGSHGLADDGQFGRVTAQAMFKPILNAAVNKAATDPALRDSLRRLTQGHIGYESNWDPGAVGVTTPVDLGLGQINGPAHPSLSPETRLNPAYAIPYIVQIVQGNLTAMGNENDAIAAYNLGIGGAREWVRLDRPEVWKGISVKRYIRGVLAAIDA